MSIPMCLSIYILKVYCDIHKIWQNKTANSWVVFNTAIEIFETENQTFEYSLVFSLKMKKQFFFISWFPLKKVFGESLFECTVFFFYHLVAAYCVFVYDYELHQYNAKFLITKNQNINNKNKKQFKTAKSHEFLS